MAETDAIQVEAVVVEPRPNSIFLVQLEDKHLVLATVSRAVKHVIRILPGDRVVVELMPGDINRGQILRRL